MKLIFDVSAIEQQPSLPPQFLWPGQDDQEIFQEELRQPPVVDLRGFFNGDQAATQLAVSQIRAACLSQGFFQISNHGVDPGLIQSVYDHMDTFFSLPMSRKMAALRKPGGLCGYSGAHSQRFSAMLPWKETFSFCYSHAHDSGDVVHYVKSSIGQDFHEAGFAFAKYCKEMKRLSLSIMELLAMSLGVERFHYRKYFEDGYSIMRGNNYPPCKAKGASGLTLGTGPHTDPNSLTILHQDQVGGLQILSDSDNIKYWRTVQPRPDTFVVNICDTFMALCNGKYKSCVHRAVVNKERVRRSVVFFVNPREDKLVKPPPDLLQNNIIIHHEQDDEDERCNDLGEVRRKYGDFTWSQLREFTQNHYRADTATLPNFLHWLSTSTSTSTSTN
ncbi:gibberellin 20 oxidase 1-D-like [Andrographis paniculata]|uniref:gibberellin 20 oxidase 1-D-like n=1 Tax=Andrographis paniculata TaxID=175694 RepID=UPI0021E7887A|nr:gibberellin 20 oxidase 1-D-like [Andrographis paniculata]